MPDSEIAISLACWPSSSDPCSPISRSMTVRLAFGVSHATQFSAWLAKANGDTLERPLLSSIPSKCERLHGASNGPADMAKDTVTGHADLRDAVVPTSGRRPSLSSCLEL